MSRDDDDKRDDAREAGLVGPRTRRGPRACPSAFAPRLALSPMVIAHLDESEEYVRARLCVWEELHGPNSGWVLNSEVGKLAYALRSTGRRDDDERAKRLEQDAGLALDALNGERELARTAEGDRAVPGARGRELLAGARAQLALSAGKGAG